MSAPGISEPSQLEAIFEHAERRGEQAAEAERAAYRHWQQTYGTYELARDEASTTWTAWAQALLP